MLRGSDELRPAHEGAQTRRSGHDGLLVNMAVQLFGKVGGLGLQLATWALITRLLGAARFGDLAAGLAAVSILEAIAEFGITATLVVRLGQSEDRAAIVSAGLVATAVTALAATVVLVPVAAFVLSPRAQTAALVLLPSSLLGIVTAALTAYWTHRLSFRRIVGASAAGQSAGLAAMGIVFTVGRSWAETRQLLGVGAALAIAALVTFAFLAPPGQDRLRRLRQTRLADARQVLVAALPLGVALSMSLIHVRVDQLVLEGYHYRLGLAYYALAYRALEGLVAGIATLGVVTFGHMSRVPHGERAAFARRGGAVLCALGCWGALGLILLARPLLLVLGGHEYTGAVAVCRLLAPVVLVSAVNGLPARTIIVEGRARVFAFVSVAGIAVNVTLSVLLVPHIGVSGAATATLVTETGGLMTCLLLAERSLPHSQPIALLAVALAGTLAVALVCQVQPGLALDLALPVGVLTASLVGALAARSYVAESALRARPATT